MPDSPPVFRSTDSVVRKMMPVASGVLGYFPDALMCVAWVSRNGNDKHNPGQPLHWDKSKSTDEPDCEVRHMLDALRGLPPDPGLEPLGRLGHLASKAWRALADLQRACDAEVAAYEAASGPAMPIPLADPCDRCGTLSGDRYGGLCSDCDDTPCELERHRVGQ